MLHPRSLAIDETRPQKQEWVCTDCNRVVPFDHVCRKRPLLQVRIGEAS